MGSCATCTQNDNEYKAIDDTDRKLSEEHISSFNGYDVQLFTQQNDIKCYKRKINDAMLNCTALKRIAISLQFYQTLTNSADEFETFINDIYNYQLLNDYFHLMEKHQHELQEISDILTSTDECEYKLDKCDIHTCNFTSRHQSSRRNDFSFQQVSSDAQSKLQFYADTMDSLHFYLFHLFECGLRSVRGQQHTKINAPNNKYSDDFLSTFSRFRDLSKFNIKKTELKAIEGTNDTYLDNVYAHLLKNDISEDHMNKLKCFIDEEQYDTDCFQFDVEHCTNISNISDNKCLDSMKDFIKCSKLRSGSFNIGIIWYYWPYYKDLKHLPLQDIQETSDNDHDGHLICDLFVTPKHNNFKEEISHYNSNDFDITEYNVSLKKAMAYVETTKAKNTKSAYLFYTKDLHYDIDKDAKLSQQHLLSMILYCDYTDLSKVFSESFRALEPFEPLFAIKLRNQNYYWWSKHLRESVQMFGQCSVSGRELDNGHLKGPFYTGISCQLYLPSLNIRLCSPTSTTRHIEIAQRFATQDGMIVRLNNDTGSSARLRGFYVSWVSKYKEEDEVLFFGGNRTIRIESVIMMKTFDNYQDFIKALYFFDCMVTGEVLPELSQAEKSKVEEIILSLVNWKLHDRKEYNWEYIYNTFDCLIMNKKQIVLSLDNLAHCNGKIRGLLMNQITNKRRISVSTEETNAINTFKMELLQIFYNTNNVIIYSTSDSGQYSYVLSLLNLLPLIVATSLDKVQIKAKRYYGDNWVKSLWNNKKMSSKIKERYLENKYTISKTLFKDPDGDVKEDCLVITKILDE